jgi:hypothetical protein
MAVKKLKISYILSFKQRVLVYNRRVFDFPGKFLEEV